MRSILLAVFVCQGLFAASVSPLICASGGALGTVDLRVASPSGEAGKALPLRTITRLEEGDIIQYRPVLRAHEDRKGDVTMVLFPANTKATGRNKVLIFAARPAKRPQQWTVPWRTSLAAFVYGPSGLSVKKVQTFLDQDDAMIGQLADYADKTEKTEALITALSSPDTSREAVGAALQGFSSQFGAATPLARTAPMNQQAMVMFSTLNPTLSSYDPLAGQGSAPVGQTAGLATLAAEMFFGSPIGLAAGGAALAMNIGELAFPRTALRSMYAQKMADDELGLCGNKGSAAVHTRIAYLWAMRIPNTAPPKLAVGKVDSLPARMKSPLPLSGSKPEWKYLNRARSWMLTPEGGKPTPVKVNVLESEKSVELDLDSKIKPGRYYLSGNWDWDKFEVAGAVDINPLGDFENVTLTPAGQKKLVAGAGKLVLTLEGSDFEFVTKVHIKKFNDEFASANSVPFVLPKGLREDVQNHMDIQLDASDLDAGSYQLTLSQVDGRSQHIPLTVLPPPPVIDNLPVMVRQGIASVTVDLKGKRLNLLQNVAFTHGTATLGPSSGDGTERALTLKLAPGLSAGTTLPLRAFVADRSDPITISDGVHVGPPRPAITSATVSQLAMQAVQLNKGELPSGVMVSALLRVSHLPDGSSVRLECEQTSTGAITLQPAEPGKTARLQQLTSDELYVTFNTAAWINGCRVEATVAGATGASDPHLIGTVVELPAIDEFKIAADPPVASGADIPATLVGRNLETIEKVGWSPGQSEPVSNLPQPISGDGVRQQLEVHLPPRPKPDSVLYVWLRGEQKARATTAQPVDASSVPPIVQTP